MIISKCVPLEISRKKFSDFLDCNICDSLYLVGYDQEQGKKKNKKVRFSLIKENIIQAIKEDPEWGQGGSGGDDDTQQGQERNTAFPISCSFEYELDDTGNPVVDDEGYPIPKTDDEGNTVINKSEDWDEEAQSIILNLNNKKGFIEINGGGNYTEEYIMFANPVIGAVTHVVVDNTGLPLPNPNNNEKPKDDFVLYYGSDTGIFGDAIEIFRVPPMCRGVVQILHSQNTDLILYSSYTKLEDNTRFVRDIDDYDNITNDPIDKTPDGSNDGSTFYIDMQNHKGFIEFPTGDRTECTFIFKSPEIGSNTHIVVDNTGQNYNGYPVIVNYGKQMDIDGDGILEPDWIETITEVENEKCIIEVFHSLSADIIVKITKV